MSEGYEQCEFFVFLLLAREYTKREGRRPKRIDMCGDPWKDRRMTSCGLYPLLSLPLVSGV